MLERYRQQGIRGYDTPGFTDQFTAPLNDEVAWVAGYGMQGAANIARNLTGRPVEVSALDRARAMRQISNEGQDRFAKEHPVQAFTGGLLGAAAMAPARGAAIPGLITEAGLGAAYGAAEGDSPSDRLSNASFGASIGLVLGGAGEIAAPYIGRLVNRFRGRGGSAAVSAPRGGMTGEAPGYRVERSQDVAPTDTPESLRAQGYEIDPATNTWARTVGTEAPPVDYPIRAYHGSPHSFDQFSLDKIGTGEGAQAYGHGLYFAENEGVARGYRDTLAGDGLLRPDGTVWNPQSLQHMNIRVAANQNGADLEATIARARDVLGRAVESSPPQTIAMARADLAELEALRDAGGVAPNPGSMYEVGINADPNTFLDWDRPLSEQPEVLQRLGFANMDEDAIHAEAARIFEAQPGGAWMEDPVSKARIDELNTMLERRPPSGTGQDFYRGGANNDVSGILSQMGYGDPAGQSQYLREAGISGIRYLDAGSRGAADVNDLRGTRSMWEGALRRSPDDAYARSMFEEADAALREAEAGLSSNYVVFNDDLVKILRKYGISGLGLSGGAALGGGLIADQQQTPAPVGL
jgi:hypothetical protein